MGTLVGTLVGALVGVFVGPLVDPLVGSNFAVRVLCACLRVPESSSILAKDMPEFFENITPHSDPYEN